jgi:hypothetical protein
MREMDDAAQEAQILKEQKDEESRQRLEAEERAELIR